MKSRSSAQPTRTTQAVDPHASNGQEAIDDLVLTQALGILRPLVHLLLSQGVTYSALTKALKAEFVVASREQLVAEGAKLTDAAVSLRSGVHRKDVRVLNHPPIVAGNTGQPASGAAVAPRPLSIAAQVYTVWTTDARYLDADGRPITLPVSGSAPSFDSLARSLSTDLSRRTILDELVRLGLVTVEGAHAKPQAAALVPTKQLEDTMHFLSENVKDHLSAGVANLNAVVAKSPPPHLEHSMYAAGLSNASVKQLAKLAGQLWKTAFTQSVDAARQRYALDETHGHTGRIRFGVYVYSEADESLAADDKSGPDPKLERAATAGDTSRTMAKRVSRKSK